VTGPSNIDLDIAIARERLRVSKAVPLEKSIDRKVGAPVGVRAAVGAAETDKDRLATLRQHFPDAQPYENGNFVYTDPKTGRPTLYNEDNPRLLGFLPIPTAGDVVSIMPEVAEVVGGTAGGIAAAPSGPVGAGVGVGLGASAGREMYGQYAQRVFGTQDTRGLPEHTADAAVTAGVNALAGPAADLVVEGGKRLLGPVNQQVKGAFDRLNIKPMAGALTGNRGVQTAEQGLSNTLGGAAPIGEAVERSVSETGEAAGRLSEEFAQGAGRGTAGAGTQTVEEVGGTIRAGAKGAADRFEQRADTLYGRVGQLIPSNTPVAIPNASALRTELQAQVAKAPESLGPVLNPLIERIGRLETDAAAGMPFDALRQIRSTIGRELNDPVLVGGTGPQKDALRELYGKLTDDMFATARAAGPDAERALTVADRYYRFSMGQNIPILEKITKAGTDGEILSIAMRGSQNGGQQIMKVRRNLQPEEWDAVAGTVLGRLGRATPGQQGASELGQEAADFSINTFLTNWSKLSVEARNALFGGTRYKDLAGPLNDLVKVVDAQKQSAKLANTSGTARSMGVQSALGGAGATLGAVAGGDVETAGYGGILGLLASTVGAGRAAKLITSPAFVKWLSTTVRIGAEPTALRAQIARLPGIANVEPALRDAIEQYMGSIQAPTPAAASDRH
jgi:hypothetical protein